MLAVNFFPVLSERDISVNEKIITKLQSPHFPEHKWDMLAAGLSLGEEIERIKRMLLLCVCWA